MSQQDFEAAIETVESQTVELTRVSFIGRTRTVALRSAWSVGRAREISPPLEPASIQPWSTSNEELARETDRVVACRRCAGQRTVVCDDCGGSVVRPCSECGGAGFRLGRRGPRAVRCSHCGGAGRRRCRCKDGVIRCSTCDGKGRHREWLEIEEERFVRTDETPDGAFSRYVVEQRGRGGDREAAAFHLAFRWHSEASEVPPPEIATALIRAHSDLKVDPAHDRVERIEVEIYRSEVVTLRLRWFGVALRLVVQSWDGALVTESGFGDALRRRSALRFLLAAVGAFVGLAAAAWYATRHPYFWATRNMTLLGLVAPLLGLAMLPVARLAGFSYSTWRRGRLASAAGPVLGLMLLQIVLLSTGWPTVARASRLADRGERDRALLAAAACVSLGREVADAQELSDRLRLELVRQAKSPGAAWRALAAEFYSPQQRRLAVELALSTTLEEARSLREVGAWRSLDTLLRNVPADFARDPRLLSERDRMEREIAREAEARVRAERLAAAREQARQKAERIAMEKQRRREEARRRSWAMAPLLCRDGSLSPTCLCGRGSYSGCCSHHGGVAGCSAD